MKNLKKTNNKAEIQTIFMYIAGIIILALFLVYGTKVIGTLISTMSSNIENAEIQKLESALDRVSKSCGSESVVNIKLPSGYNAILFFNFENMSYNSFDLCNADNIIEPSKQLVKNECLLYKKINENINKGTYNNIFIAKKSGLSYTDLKPYLMNEKIITDGKAEYIDAINGIIKIKLINDRQKVIVKSP